MKVHSVQQTLDEKITPSEISLSATDTGFQFTPPDSFKTHIFTVSWGAHLYVLPQYIVLFKILHFFHSKFFKILNPVVVIPKMPMYSMFQVY